MRRRMGNGVFKTVISTDNQRTRYSEATEYKLTFMVRPRDISLWSDQRRIQGLAQGGTNPKFYKFFPHSRPFSQKFENTEGGGGWNPHPLPPPS